MLAVISAGPPTLGRPRHRRTAESAATMSIRMVTAATGNLFMHYKQIVTMLFFNLSMKNERAHSHGNP
jgi:hypothetical protein